jgi:single-strand DNA-binding protein
MNSITIIGNVTRDPELRTTQTGKEVCSFTVAVNRRKSVKAGVQETDYFKITAWEKLAAICKEYLVKGSKVAVVGSVSVSTYEKGGNHYASLDVTATNVEFIGTKRSDADDTGLSYTPPNSTPSVPTGFVPVVDDDLPF